MNGTLPRPFIVDSAGERHLLFTSANVQSSMRFDDPYALVTAYTRKMMAFLLLLSGQMTRYPTHIQSLCRAFDGTVVLVPVQAEGNVLLFALQRPPLAEVPRALYDRATELEEALGLEFHRFLQCLRTAPTLTARADCS